MHMNKINYDYTEYTASIVDGSGTYAKVNFWARGNIKTAEKEAANERCIVGWKEVISVTAV